MLQAPIPQLFSGIEQANRGFSFDELCPSASSVQCDCGGCLRPEAVRRPPGARSDGPRLYGLTSFKCVVLKQLVCDCGRVFCYDGREDGVLNLNNWDLFTHDVLTWYVPLVI
jgi:CxC4 like cysteine cluster associated with KDZ transposases